MYWEQSLPVCMFAASQIACRHVPWLQNNLLSLFCPSILYHCRGLHLLTWHLLQSLFWVWNLALCLWSLKCLPLGCSAVGRVTCSALEAEWWWLEKKKHGDEVFLAIWAKGLKLKLCGAQYLPMCVCMEHCPGAGWSLLLIQMPSGPSSVGVFTLLAIIIAALCRRSFQVVNHVYNIYDIFIKPNPGRCLWS